MSYMHCPDCGPYFLVTIWRDHPDAPDHPAYGVAECGHCGHSFTVSWWYGHVVERLSPKDGPNVKGMPVLTTLRGPKGKQKALKRWRAWKKSCWPAYANS